MIEFIDDEPIYYRIKGKNAKFEKKIPPKLAMDVKIPEGVFATFEEWSIIVETDKFSIEVSIDYNSMSLQEALDFVIALGNAIYEKAKEKYGNELGTVSMQRFSKMAIYDKKGKIITEFSIEYAAGFFI